MEGHLMRVWMGAMVFTNHKKFSPSYISLFFGYSLKKDQLFIKI